MNNKIPIIVLSSSEDIAKKALLRGADDFIIKSDAKIECIKDQIIDLLYAYGTKAIKSKIIHNINLKLKTNEIETNNTVKEETLNTINTIDENLTIKKDIIENKDFDQETIIDEEDLKKLKNRKFDIVVIGISTGGPVALKTILPEIPENFPIPIIIVQHMPKVYIRICKKP